MQTKLSDISGASKPPVAATNKPKHNGPRTPPISAAEKNTPAASPSLLLGIAGNSTNTKIVIVYNVPRTIPCKTSPASNAKPGSMSNRKLDKSAMPASAAISLIRRSGVAKNGTTTAAASPTRVGIEAHLPAVAASMPRSRNSSGSQLLREWCR